MRFIPSFHTLDRCLAAERRLGQMRVVEGDIPAQGLFQIQGRIEVMGLEDLAVSVVERIGDAAVETLDHAVGLRCLGRRQPVFDA